MKAKDIFKTIIENEIDISFEIAQHWYTYQNLSVKKGYEKIARIQFLDCVKVEIEKSLFIQKDWYLEWIEGQFENKLENISSGSTMTALLDVDNVFNLFESAIMEVEEELVNELYGEIINYQHKLIGNLSVERGIDLY
tara:strand:+ start:580 stop:993 length:414 start_codon:yes stop_codon:yes gene_type:complete